MDKVLREALRLLKTNPDLVSDFLKELPLFVVATIDSDDRLHEIHGPFSSREEANTYCETLTCPEDRYLRAHVTQLRKETNDTHRNG